MSTDVLKTGPWPRVWLVALYGVTSYAFCSPLFARPSALGVFDWDQHLFYYGAVLKNVVEYGQMPFWNPWYCGGNVLWQNPQIALLSPVYPLTALMPLALAMKINILLHYWLGFLGMHVLLRRVVGLRSLPIVIFLATMFVASGAPAIHFYAGHSVFLPAFYLPILMYWYFTAITSGGLRWSMLAGGAIALMVYNGGTHIMPMAFAAIGLISLAVAVMRRQWRPIVIGLVCCVAGLAYSAPKLLPVVSFVSSEQFWDTRPEIEHPDRTTLEMASGVYLDPFQLTRNRLPEQRHGWHEYGNYIGEFAALLIAASLLWIVTARGTPNYWFGLSVALATIAFFLLSLGEFSRLAPASLATHLPLFFELSNSQPLQHRLCALRGYRHRLDRARHGSRYARGTHSLVRRRDLPYRRVTPDRPEPDDVRGCVLATAADDVVQADGRTGGTRDRLADQRVQGVVADVPHIDERPIVLSLLRVAAVEAHGQRNGSAGLHR